MTIELKAVVLARYKRPYMQQKHMDRIVARTGKSRVGLTCEKNLEYGMPPLVCVLEVARSKVKE